jgi:hypothetical protein
MADIARYPRQYIVTHHQFANKCRHLRLGKSTLPVVAGRPWFFRMAMPSIVALRYNGSAIYRDPICTKWEELRYEEVAERAHARMEKPSLDRRQRVCAGNLAGVRTGTGRRR